MSDAPTSDPAKEPRFQRRTAEPRKSRDARRPAERDYDRILYSSALRRLGGVTQVVAAHEGHVFHNRLTHSLRVSQLSRRLAQKLIHDNPKLDQAVDIDVAESAGLAHDLGHPPFGHIGEEVLRKRVLGDGDDDPLGNNDAFEGNAQSFRIVTQLALSSPQVPGLNLTRSTLNALLKYPYPRHSDGQVKSKYGYYVSEQEDFRFARALMPRGDQTRCAEAEIMDWADDVTYAVHDAEDFYRAGLIPLHRLAPIDDKVERRRFFDGMYSRSELRRQMGDEPRAVLESAFEKVVTPFNISEPFSGTDEQRARLRWYSSVLIGQFVAAIELQTLGASRQPYISIDPEIKRRVRMLKALTWFYVIYNPALATQQHGQKRMIGDLFGMLLDAATSTNDQEHNIIPLPFQDAVLQAKTDQRVITRLVADMIASMTEGGLVKLYRRLTGIDMGSILDHANA